MSVLWAKNMAGFELGDEELKSISYPRLELTTHITTKCVELFGVAGTLVFGPLAAGFRKQTRNMTGVVKMSTKFGKRGVVLGMVVGPMMTFGKMRNTEGDEPFYDRCYRLRNNHNQVRVDRAAYIGTLAGALASPLVFKMCPIFGGLVGLSVGTLATGVYNKYK